MANVVNYATKYESTLDQVLKQNALTTELETPNVNWLGAKSFQVSTVSTSGFKPHKRNKGYNEGSVKNDREIYTLDFDRDIEFFVDTADVDESNQDLSAANVTKTFLTEHAIPEMDSYRFSKLATIAKKSEKTHKEEEVSKANVFDRLKDSILPVRKYGAGNILTYVSSEVMDALERSESFNRKIEVQNIGPSSIETRITSIDGVKLVEVWDTDRFHTVFDFTDGFKPGTDASAINFLTVAKPNVIAKAKIESIYFFAPGQHTEGDGFLYQNRMYHDLFVLKNKADGVFVSYKATTP